MDVEPSKPPLYDRLKARNPSCVVWLERARAANPRGATQPYKPVLLKEPARPRNPVQDGCEHDWKIFKQRIRNTNSRNAGDWDWYFIVRACPKCKTKTYVDLRKV